MSINDFSKISSTIILAVLLGACSGNNPRVVMDDNENECVETSSVDSTCVDIHQSSSGDAEVPLETSILSVFKNAVSNETPLVSVLIDDNVKKCIVEQYSLACYDSLLSLAQDLPDVTFQFVKNYGADDNGMGRCYSTYVSQYGKFGGYPKSYVSLQYDVDSYKMIIEKYIDSGYRATELDKIFEEAVRERRKISDVLKNETISRIILQHGSRKFYDKALSVCQNEQPFDYFKDENGTAEGFYYAISRAKDNENTYIKMTSFLNAQTFYMDVYDDGEMVSRYLAPEPEEMREEFEDVAIYVEDVVDSYNNQVKSNKYYNRINVFKYSFESVKRSSKSEYKYLVSCEFLTNQYVYLYTNDETFARMDYPISCYFRAKYGGRSVNSAYYDDPLPERYYYFYDGEYLVDD